MALISGHAEADVCATGPTYSLAELAVVDGDPGPSFPEEEALWAENRSLLIVGATAGGVRIQARPTYLLLDGDAR